MGASGLNLPKVFRLGRWNRASCKSLAHFSGRFSMSTSKWAAEKEMPAHGVVTRGAVERLSPPKRGDEALVSQWYTPVIPLIEFHRGNFLRGSTNFRTDRLGNRLDGSGFPEFLSSEVCCPGRIGERNSCPVLGRCRRQHHRLFCACWMKVGPDSDTIRSKFPGLQHGPFKHNVSHSSGNSLGPPRRRIRFVRVRVDLMCLFQHDSGRIGHGPGVRLCLGAPSSGCGKKKPGAPPPLWVSPPPFRNWPRPS